MTNWAANLSIFRWHAHSVHVPRVQHLRKAIADLVPQAQSMLDIGCGDGTLARDVAATVGASGDLCGVDVRIRPNAVIDTRPYDGKRLPFEDGRFELVTICDVLHHTDNAAALIREALRVLAPHGNLVIKDHFAFGAWSRGVLWLMDVVGNFAPGVSVPANYFSPPEWIDLVTEAGGLIGSLTWPLHVHSQPWRSVARSEYQFLMLVKRR